jgi:uncharacterized protein YndB with AHSA1/START domain
MTAAASSAGHAPTAIGWDGADLVITRVFPAPRETVFRAWSEPEHFARWWGPHGSTLPFCQLDARPGGALHYQHHFPDYPDVWIGGTYREIAAPERIAFACWFSNAAGDRVERPGFPAEMTITVAFDEHPDGTLVTIRHAGLTEEQGEVQGWTESLDRLASLLAASHTSTTGDQP